MFHVTKAFRVALIGIPLVMVGLTPLAHSAAQRVDPSQRTSPQIVAGMVGENLYETTITIQNLTSVRCLLDLSYHQGAGNRPGSSDLPVTNGMPIINPSSPTLNVGIDGGGTATLRITEPPSKKGFIGAGSMEIHGGNALVCASELVIQTTYNVFDPLGKLLETFSYGETPQVPINSCVQVPATLFRGVGRSQIPALAAVSDTPLNGVNQCIEVYDSDGKKVRESCEPYDGGHSARLITELIPDLDDFDGRIKVCYRGPMVENLAFVDFLSLHLVTEGGGMQFNAAPPGGNCQ